ncbi:MAG: hypothetical protein U0354_15670 [Candidatus Sericytochromatia bacterium]
MLKLHFVTSGYMLIDLEELSIDYQIRDPVYNVKTFATKPNQIILDSENLKFFTDWGVVSLTESKAKNRIIKVTLDCLKWGWYSSAQIVIERDGQIILNDNFQSGTRGPVGNPVKVRNYNV